MERSQSSRGILVLAAACMLVASSAAAAHGQSGSATAAGSSVSSVQSPGPNQGAPTVASSDSIQVTVHGAVQADGRAFLDGDHPQLPNTFLVRRARVYVDATLHGWIGFRIMPDFAGGKLTLFDAYFEARFGKGFVVRAGKFKVPIGLERLQSGSDIRFVERAFPTLLAPNRDVGVGVYGDLAKGRVWYAASLTNGVPDGLSGDTDADRGKDVAARVTVQPWDQTRAKRLGVLTVGFGGSWGQARGTPSLPGLPVVDLTGIETVIRFRSGSSADASVVAGGTRARVSPQATYYRGPFGMMAEYIATSEDLVKGEVRARRSMNAWQLAGSWILTGEANSYKGVTPNRPLVPGSGHWGAVELAARYTRLGVGSSVFPVFADPAVTVRSAEAVGVAINWYWNPSVKVVLDYERVAFVGGAAVGNRPTAHMLLGRLQCWF